VCRPERRGAGALLDNRQGPLVAQRDCSLEPADCRLAGTKLTLFGNWRTSVVEQERALRLRNRSYTPAKTIVHGLLVLMI
jgi:hypothetical protein